MRNTTQEEVPLSIKGEEGSKEKAVLNQEARALMTRDIIDMVRWNFS